MSTSGSNQRARALAISIRTTPDEKRAITARANYHGLSVGAFMRMAALAQSLPRGKSMHRSQGQFIAIALSSLGALMEEVRRIEQRGHAEQPELENMRRELLFLRDHCFSAMGRKP